MSTIAGTRARLKPGAVVTGSEGQATLPLQEAEGPLLQELADGQVQPMDSLAFPPGPGSQLVPIAHYPPPATAQPLPSQALRSLAGLPTSQHACLCAAVFMVVELFSSN